MSLPSCLTCLSLTESKFLELRISKRHRLRDLRLFLYFSEGFPHQPRAEQGDSDGHLQRRMQEDLRQEEDHRLNHLRQERRQQRGRRNLSGIFWVA